MIKYAGSLKKKGTIKVPDGSQSYGPAGMLIGRKEH
jgi:hypothetical protein